MPTPMAWTELSHLNIPNREAWTTHAGASLTQAKLVSGKFQLPESSSGLEDPPEIGWDLAGAAGPGWSSEKESADFADSLPASVASVFLG